MERVDAHSIKSQLGPFQEVWDGIKTFEWRENDRNYAVGDFLLLNEWNSESVLGEDSEFCGRFTGRIILAKVTSMLEEEFGVTKGYCVMSIKVVYKSE